MKTQGTKEPLPVRFEDPNTPAQIRSKLLELLLVQAQQRQKPPPQAKP